MLQYYAELQESIKQIVHDERKDFDNLKTIELFAGIGGFRIAADENNLITVFANDIDHNAAMVYRSVFGDESIIEGDIYDYINSIPDHDILTGGFPCQPFSKAGKKMGIEDYRGTLFEVIVKILSDKQPKHFVLENVNSLLYMDNGRHFRTILFALANLDYKIEWRVFNAQQFGLPQHRERVIIVGTKNMKANETYFFDGVDESNCNVYQINKFSDYCLWDDILESSKKFDLWGMALKDRFITAPVVKTMYSSPKKLIDILERSVDAAFDFTEETLLRIKNSQYTNKYYNDVQILYNQSGGARMGYSIFGVDGIAPTLTASTSRHYERYKIGDRYRRLTNKEYARIQGFPDNHCAVLSTYNQYKLYGNAVPPQIISYVFRKILTSGVRVIGSQTLSLLNFMEV